MDSTTTYRGGSRTNLRRQRQLLLLLCGVQKKLHHLGWDVPLLFSQFWMQELHKGFLKGCEWYINGYTHKAIQCWHLTTLQAQTQHSTSITPPSTTSSSSVTQEQRPPSSTPLLTASLVAILYTHLENYDLLSVLKLIDRLIHCYQGDAKVKGHRLKKGVPTRLVRTDLSFLETIRKSGKVHFTAVLPCVPLDEHRAVVACLARWMALYFTNQPLFIFPACSAVLMPSLIQAENTEYGTTTDQPRTLPLYHDRISGAIRQQELSEVWTVDTALALFLVCGLVPEAVWLARELGDWKNAFTLAVLYSEQNSWVIQLPSSVDTKHLVLPGHLTPDAIMKEGLSSILQTPGEKTSKSKLERRGSMGSSGNSSVLQVPSTGGMKKSSSMCSIHDEDKASQEQRSKSLTDMLTAAALIGLDPTLWLLGNMTDACLLLVAEFNTLVPEDFYLPAPPYYCPQPKYIPKEGEAEQVLNEARIRHEINDVIQGILLVLNASHCSLPCAKWYVQLLGGLLRKEGKRKKSASTQLPKALAEHTKYQLDLLEGFSSSKSDQLSASLTKLLQCFRNLCTIVWLLHVRDKLSTAIRKYQARRERSLRVKPEDPSELEQHKILLISIIEWAGCLHPFMKFLQMEDEIQDILLTAISELSPNKQTVSILAKYFHNGEDGLYPAVEEKFGRLMEKLKRKREVVDKKQRKQEEKKEEGKGKMVKFETLQRYYKRQCQRRKIELNNRKDSYGSFEEHIFDPEQVIEDLYGTQPTETPSTSKGNGVNSPKKSPSKTSDTATSKKGQIVEYHKPYHEGEEDPVSLRQSAHSHPKRKKLPHQLSFTQDEDLSPVVGSREFENNPSYLDFLETFFLVAFGKIAQNLSQSTKPDAPLLGMFSERLKKQELNPVVSKMLSRQKSKIELDISSTLRLPSDHSTEVRATNFDMVDSDDDEVESTDDGVVTKIVPQKGLFRVLGRMTDEADNVLNETIYGKVFSTHGYRMTTPTPTPRRRPSEDAQFTGTFLHNEPTKPYMNVRLNLGKKYQKHVDLLQWLARWTERQQRALLHHGGVEQESKAMLKVRLPQQLMLNSLWLLENCYYPTMFQPDVLATQTTMPSITEESTSSQRVQFADSDSRSRTPKDVGKPKLGRDGKPSVVQAMMKPSSSSEDLIDGIDEVRGDTDDLVAKMRRLLVKKTKSKKSKKVNDAAAEGVKVERSKARRSEAKKKSKRSKSVEENVKGEELEVPRSESRQRSENDGLVPDRPVAGDANGKESTGRNTTREKAKKKRKLPVVTSEHLDTAVDYKTEAQKARELLKSPITISSLRSSPSQLSTASTPTRDGNQPGSKVIGEDVPDGRQSGRRRKEKVTKEYKRSGERGRNIPDRGRRDDDSDSSSLNVSSLDEEEAVEALQRDLAGPTSSQAAGNSALSLKSSPTDVRKMVQDEFKKMMGKSLMEVLNSTSTPSGSKSKPPSVAIATSTTSATDPQQESVATDPTTFLHPQAQSAHGVHNAGTQAEPQLLLQTWHGQESMLHHQSLRQTKPSHRSNDRMVDNDKGIAGRDSDDRYYSELRNQHGSHGNGSLPSHSNSGHHTEPLTLQDLDSAPLNKNRTQVPETSVLSVSPHIRDTSLPHRHIVDDNTMPHYGEVRNRNNNANQNQGTSQNGRQAHNGPGQNGWQDEDEYDTIPTRDSDEFVPSNSTSSHPDNGVPTAPENNPLHPPQSGQDPPPSQNVEDDVRRRPPPEYHNTFAFAQPGAPPPLLRLHHDDGYGRSHEPPPAPPLQGQFPPPPSGDRFPFSPRQGWPAPDDADISRVPGSAPLHVTLQQEGPLFMQRHGSKGFLPQIQLLTLDHRGPVYQPPPQPPPPSGPSPRIVPMPLLTLDPRRTHHHHQPPQFHRSNFPYVPAGQQQMEPMHRMEPPPTGPMPLLRLDDPLQPYLFKSSRGGVGTVQLIPPEEIIAFEQKKHREKMKRLREQEEAAGVAGEQVREGHMPLLHLDNDKDHDDAEFLRQRREPKKAKASTLPDAPACTKAPSSRTKTKPKRTMESTTTATSDDERPVEVVEDVGRRRRRGSRRKQIVKLIDMEAEEHGQTAEQIPTEQKEEENESELEMEDSQGERDDGTQSSESDDAHKKAAATSSATAAAAANQDVGDGYAIKPGTYDSVLETKSTQPPYEPTSSAAIHLSVVKKLQEPPQRRDAGMMTSQQRDVSTSMDTNGLSLDPAMRFADSMDPVSQYTTAATGVSDAGNIIAPDIFFGLRFGNRGNQSESQAEVTEQAVPNKDTTKTAPNSARDFISVVDIDSNAITEILHHQPTQTSKPVDSTHRPSALEREGMGGEVREGRVDSGAGPEPSIAELHYNSLFHRDAHPEGHSPLSTQQMTEDQAGPDAVTVQLLDSKRKPSHSLKSVKGRSQSAREQSKHRVYQRLEEMAEQLDAIDEVSKHMEDDFKNTKLMLNTVEQLTDTMASSRSRPKPDWTEAEQDQMATSEPAKLQKHGARRQAGQTTQGGHNGDAEEKNRRMERREEGEEGDKGGEEGQEKKLHVTINEERMEQDQDVPERGPQDDSEDVLGITGLSGVSDIVAEALADVDAKDLGISDDTRHKLQAKRAKKEEEESTPDLGLDTLDLTALSRDQLREIFTPRSQLTTDEDEDEALIPTYAKKPSERSEAQRQELKEWMSKKQAKNLAEYKKKREELAELEPRPYQPPKNSQLGSTQKELQQAEVAREGKRRMTDEEHFQERAKAARQLMAEIIAETPTLPPEPESRLRTSQRASKSNQTVTKPKGRQKAPPRGGSAKQGVPKGTYLFIDSGVYPPTQSFNRSRTLGADTQIGRESKGQRSGRDPYSRYRDEVPPLGLEYSSDEDNFGMDAISERTETNKENEPVRDYKPQKSYKDMVRVQRPEVTRRKRSPRKQKTYGDMLKELRQETSRPGSSGGIRDQQRLYGSKRVPGTYKRYKRQSPRAPKPYTQRLAEMKVKGQTTSRLRVRPRSRGPQFGTSTVTLDPATRRQQVEGRGLRAEATPRTSTPYTERLGMLSNTGTYRGRAEGVVSPAPKLGLPYKPKTGQMASTYVERLQDTVAGVPKPKHKTAYVGALGATYKSPPMGATYKSPQLHTPSPRSHPYHVAPQEDQDVNLWEEDELSGISDVSPWSLSDDVKRILQEDASRESLARGYTTEDDFDALDSFGDQDDYLTSVDVRELEEIASIGSESISNIDWAAVDKMIEDVQ